MTKLFQSSNLTASCLARDFSPQNERTKLNQIEVLFFAYILPYIPHKYFHIHNIVQIDVLDITLLHRAHQNYVLHGLQ